MFKVIIVDDEILVRVGIKSLIDWETYGFTVVGEAADGNSALELIREKQPSIVLTDIIMPGMDGLALIRQTLAEFPHVKFIVLSCHNDYQYVREAMKSGAVDYVLKLSMLPEDLVEVLKTTAAKIMAEGGRDEPSAAGRQNDPGRLFALALDSDAPLSQSDCRELSSGLGGDTYAVLLTEYEQPGGVQRGVNMKEILATFLEQKFGENFRVAVAVQQGRRIEVLAGAGDTALSQEWLRNAATEIAGSCRLLFGVTVRIASSRITTGFGRIRQAQTMAEEAMRGGFYSDDVYFAYSDDMFSHDTAGIITAEDSRLLTDALERGDVPQAKKKIAGIFEQIRTLRLHPDEVPLELIELLLVFRNAIRNMFPDIGREKVNMSSHSLYSTIRTFRAVGEAEDWFCSYAERFCHNLRRLRATEQDPEIRRVCEYIREHYRENITLRQAARQVGLSEGYLSHLFSAKMGISFTDYLTDTRLKRACELLKTTGDNIERVGEQAGFADSAYFCRLFKKYHRMSPGAYRQQYRQKI